MASSSSHPTLDFSSQSWIYDVFISFRGEDTRKNFVDHLYSALVQQGIYTYKDDETLPRGQSIGPALFEAIQKSRIAIIIFSENYGDSSWCLDELAYIMKCREERRQIVMPVFYHVDPSHVRKQLGNYGEAFIKHESENKDKVESWKKALFDASNISGWETKHVANGHESKCIKEIVKTVFHSLHLYPSVNGDLVGIEARMQALISKLEIGSDGVRMVGIWGVGGGGKTTLASSVYDAISAKFDSCCFVDNIREESSKYGLKKLQERILSGVLKYELEVKIMTVDEGREKIKKRLSGEKVLIVLDDVDKLEQLKALAGSDDWFGKGSLIIITTRDIHVLNAHKVDVMMHDISLLTDIEGIELFCKHAPRGNRPLRDYDRYLKDVVSYAGGLPLALKVLGCFLCDKDMNEWRSALARIKEIPDTDIVGKLKISYDGLKDVDKNVFLDIACFFRRRSKKMAMEMLDACGFHPVIGVKVLIQKALIFINSYDEFDMHDLVQEMGHFIVREKHPKNPAKHSRVWQMEDVLNICAMNNSVKLDKIKAIRYYPSVATPHPKVIANMKNLRWIEWNGLPGNSLPQNFLTQELCGLILWKCGQLQLWQDYTYLHNLRIIKLVEMACLRFTPNFDELPNLKGFMLDNCGLLEEIHPSIGYSKSLEFIEIETCYSLKIFPSITRSTKLKTVKILYCPNLVKVSNTQQGYPDMIQRELSPYSRIPIKLDIQLVHTDVTDRDVWLPHKQYPIKPRKWFGFRMCCNDFGSDTELNKQPDMAPYFGVKRLLEYLPTPYDNINHIGLQLSHIGLRKLYLNHCDLGNDDIKSAVGVLPNLQELDLSGNKFSEVNFRRLNLPRLKWLNVSYCDYLTILLDLPSSIAVVRADTCSSLQYIGGFYDCPWLWKFSLRGYDGRSVVGRMLNSTCGLKDAIEDHFISVTVPVYNIRKECVDRFVKGERFILHLQVNDKPWYDDFCGFFICIVTEIHDPVFTIILKPVIGMDFQSDISESNEATVPAGRVSPTYVGYVSFNLLKRHTPHWDSAYSKIFISVTGKNMRTNNSMREDEISFGAALVPRKSKDHAVRTEKVASDCSEYWDEEFEDRKTFTIQHDDSNSSIKIVWHPY